MLFVLVEWSCAQNFKPLVGEVFISDLQNLKYDITGLECGCPYYVRVTAWNMKGFGKGSLSDPSYAIPSSEYFILLLLLLAED